MYVKGKMRSVDAVPGMGEGRQRRMMEGVNSTMIYLIYCKKFCKCHNLPPVTTIKKRKSKGNLLLLVTKEKKNIVNSNHTLELYLHLISQ
jgi:hypothetical protein